MAWGALVDRLYVLIVVSRGTHRCGFRGPELKYLTQSCPSTPLETWGGGGGGGFTIVQDLELCLSLCEPCVQEPSKARKGVKLIWMTDMIHLSVEWQSVNVSLRGISCYPKVLCHSCEGLYISCCIVRYNLGSNSFFLTPVFNQDKVIKMI